MDEPGLPDGVTRRADGGYRVAGPRTERAIEVAVIAVVLVVGVLLAVVGGLLVVLVGGQGPGSTFLAVGGLLTVGGLVMGASARRRRRGPAWELGREGLTRHRPGPGHVAWGEVATLVLWDRHARTSGSGGWARHVSVLALDADGRERLHVPSENTGRRLRAIFRSAMADGLVPEHVTLEHRQG